MSVETARLTLTPLAPGDLLALIEGEDAFEHSFGLPAAAGLRRFLVSDDVSPDWLAQLRASSETDPWKHGFALVHRDTRHVIGNLAFKGAPDAAGVVEVAYGVVPAFEDHGYATEAARAAVDLAFADDRVCTVRAHTLPENNASTRVLEKCGFQRVSDIVDPGDGRVWRWELKRQTA